MMREILFRGKRVSNGEWVYGYYVRPTHHWHKYGIHDDWIVTNTVQNGGWCNIRGKYAVIPETVGQYTGLADKNGKKIFEGDVVKIYYSEPFCETGYIKFDETKVRFVVLIVEEGSYSIDNTFECEVIGNIHDNPELMEGDVK